ncbi:formimidoylglutamate deiminase, partial [Dickeya dadantii]|nr:formimidoylglutamate deiminase [Dickeya dadantii]
VGELSAGWRADWLVLREDALLSALPDDSLLNRWLFAGDRQQIRDVWVAGKPVIEDGRHALDEEVDARFIEVMRTLQAVM